MLAEAAAAIGSLKSASDVVQAMIATRDAAKFNAQLSEMLESLVNARLKTLEIAEKYEELISQNRELQSRLDAKDQWVAEAKNFNLTEISRGMYAYLHKDNSMPFKQAQKYCVNCFDDKRSKSLLQLQVVNPGRRNVLVCHQCTTQLELYMQAFLDETPEASPLITTMKVTRG